jgi:hypothetical protein
VLFIDDGGSDLENGTDQSGSTYDILIICGDFAAQNSPDPRSALSIVLFPSLCRCPLKIEVDNFTFSQCFKAQLAWEVTVIMQDTQSVLS